MVSSEDVQVVHLAVEGGKDRQMATARRPDGLGMG
jgi:hypothetical protein